MGIDLDSLLDGKPVKNNTTVATAPKPRTNDKDCKWCGKYQTHDKYRISSSEFFPNGRIDICDDCLESWFGDYGYSSEGITESNSWEKANKLCQYMDIGFDPNIWSNCVQATRGHFAFKVYCEQAGKDPKLCMDWDECERIWKQWIQEGVWQTHMDTYTDQEMEELRNKWGRDFTTKEILEFEGFYKDIEKTQTVVTAIQRENAKKMCILSVKMNELLASGEEKVGNEIKSLIGAYNDLAKAAEFNPKTAKNVGDFESVGELCAFLEKKGFKTDHFNWEARDEIDKMMNNIQNYTKRIVIGESNIADDLNDKLEQIKNLQREENLDDGADVDDLEDFDPKFYDGEGDEDFLAEFNETLHVDGGE